MNMWKAWQLVCRRRTPRTWLALASGATFAAVAGGTVKISVERSGQYWNVPKHIHCESGTAESGQQFKFKSFFQGFADAYNLPVRLLRDVHCVVTMGWIYHQAQQAKEPTSAAHQKSADVLVNLCRKNGGVYIKIGQMLGVLEHIVPLEYTRAMQTMFSDSPRSSSADIRMVLESEIGRPLEEVFATFQEEPIASASLAQVHIATLVANGQKVAIKVQHPSVQASAAVDLATISRLARATRYFFPRVDYVWLAEEAERNLPLELDFQHEMENARTLKRLLAHRNDVVVPEIFPELSSKRVIVMSYEDGVSPTDLEGLSSMGLSKAGVAALIGDVFCEKIFVHGFVHGDPHPGNLLVRPMPAATVPSRARSRNAVDRQGLISIPASPASPVANLCHQLSTWLMQATWGLLTTVGLSHPLTVSPQLVILDHGLYRTLTTEIRMAYAGFWKAVLMGDEASMRKHADALGAGDLFPIVASILTRKTYDVVLQRGARVHGGLPQSLMITGSQHEKEALQKNVQEYLFDINDLFRRCNSDVLLLFKTHDCLMHTFSSLGSPMTGLACTGKYVDRMTMSPPSSDVPQLDTVVHSVTEWGSWLKYKIITSLLRLAASMGF